VVFHRTTPTSTVPPSPSSSLVSPSRLHTFPRFPPIALELDCSSLALVYLDTLFTLSLFTSARVAPIDRGMTHTLIAVYIGSQETFGAPIALFNLLHSLPDHPVGSTVSAQTLRAHGVAIPSGLTLGQIV
jgi:hypothetical protein